MTSDPEAWQEAIDQLQAISETLNDRQVPRAEAQKAAQLAEQIERKLWRWRRSVEASYLTARNRLPLAILEVADREEVPVPVVLTDLIQSGAIQPVWWKLNRWASEHGVTMWPTDDNENDSETGANI